jgi:hypothetical protein
MFPEDVIVLFFKNFNIMVVGLERVIVLGEYFFVIVEFHEHGFGLLIFLMQFLVGEFLFIEFPLDPLEFVVEVFEIVLVESAFVLELFFEVVGFLGEGGLELLDCAALLLQGVGKGDNLFLEIVSFRVTGFQVFLELVDA